MDIVLWLIARIFFPTGRILIGIVGNDIVFKRNIPAIERSVVPDRRFTGAVRDNVVFSVLVLLFYPIPALLMWTGERFLSGSFPVTVTVWACACRITPTGCRHPS